MGASEPLLDVMNPALRRMRLLAEPLAWALALGCAGAVAAELFWRVRAPPPFDRPVRPDTDPRAVALRIAGQQPFGGGTAVSAEAAPGPSDRRIELLGLATGFAGGSGFALLKLDDRPAAAYTPGEELSGGLRLRRILDDGIELERLGQVETLRMPAAASAGIEPAGPARPAEPPPSAAVDRP